MMPDDALSGNLSDMAGMFGQAQDQAETQPWKIKTETDGTGEPTTTITAPHKDILAIQQKMGYLEQALASMSQHAAQLQQREEETRRHPLMNVLAQVAGNLAAGDKRLPPIVAALGKTSLALNPPPEQLAQERLGIQSRMGQLGVEGAQFGLAQVRENRLEQRAQAETEQKKIDDQTKLFRDLGNAAMKGQLTNAGIVSTMLQQSGVLKGKADTQAQVLVDISKEQAKIASDKASAATEKDKRDIESREKIADARTNAMLAAIAGRGDKKGDARSDKSYAFSIKELDTMRNPVKDRLQRLSTLQDTINQHTPAADALVAPELLTVMAGGQGSGLRMNEAEIARIVGGRTNWESLKAAVNRWQLNPEKGLSITVAQRDQIKRLLGTVTTRLQRRQDALADAYTGLIDTDDPKEHRKIVNEARKAFDAASGENDDKPKPPLTAFEK